MKHVTINTHQELKLFVKENRNLIIGINGIHFGELYPMLEVTNKHASYYNVDTQCDTFINAPFNVTYKN